MNRMPARTGVLVVGLFLYGIAISLMVRASVGVAPWDVLSQGISLRTGIPFGFVTNLVGVLVLLVWLPLRQKPGIGTVLNVLLIGPSAQLGLWLIPAPDSLLVRIPLFVAGLVLLASATGIYLGPRLGPGPRDGLMTGLVARTTWPVWVIRTLIEATVTAIGWVLGGNVGVGTLVFALAIGPLIQVALRVFRALAPGAAPRPRLQRVGETA